MPPAVERSLSDLVEAARSVLGSGLVGAYPAGSLGLSAFQPGRSDIDIALVCAQPLDLPTKQRLVEALRQENLPVPARGLELVVYTLAAARSGTAEPAFEVELNTGPAMDFRATYGGDQRDPADGLFWYGLDRSILRESTGALLGPPVGAVFGPIAEDDLRRLLVESLRWWMALPLAEGPAPGAEDAVLGACRALVRVRSGRWLAKNAAARELIAEGRDVELLEASIAARSGGPPVTGAAARAFQGEVLAALMAE